MSRVFGSARLAAVLALLGGSATACSGAEEETCEIATADMSAVALVIDSGLDIRAAVDFELGDRRGRGAPLRLCDTDRLTINGSTPTEIDKADRIEYSVTLEPDAERSFSFVLDREAQGDRVTFDVQLPDALEFLSPMDGDPIPVADAQQVQWEPPLADGVIEVGMTEALGGGQCLVADTDGHTYEDLGGVQVPDTGLWDIPAGVLRSESLDPCATTYSLTRLASGDYPTDFERGGRVEARVERYQDVLIVP